MNGYAADNHRLDGLVPVSYRVAGKELPDGPDVYRSLVRMRALTAGLKDRRKVIHPPGVTIFLDDTQRASPVYEAMDAELRKEQ